MKIIITLSIMILIINSLYADNLSDFRRLSTDEKIQRILEEYKYDRNYVYRLRFAQYASILTENPKENILFLFQYLENTSILPATENDKTYRIIDNIIWRYFFIDNNLLIQEELDKLKSIYHQKILEYLVTYKTIDIYIVLTEERIDFISGKRGNGQSNVHRATADSLYEKYTKLGPESVQKILQFLVTQRNSQ